MIGLSTAAYHRLTGMSKEGNFGAVVMTHTAESITLTAPTPNASAPIAPGNANLALTTTR